MSNSSLVTYTKISPNSTNPRNHAIDTITIHHIAGVLTAKQIANLTNFTDPKYEASCNYAVGNDGSIALIVEEKNRSWCTSSRENDHRAITIEVSNSATGDPWPVSDKALEATIELCVDICKRNNIKKINFTGDKTGNLTMHKWFAATGCPGPYLSEKFPYIAEEINKRLGVKPEPTPVDEKRELHLGDTGEDVKALQKDLIKLGYDLGYWGADGDFGAATDKAVRKFQKEHNLDVDGWVGKNTYVAIDAALAEKQKPAQEVRPFKVGDEVKLKAGAKYTSGKVPQSWVYNSKLYVRELQANNTVVISTLATGAVTGIVYEKDLEYYEIPEKSVNYLVTVTADLLNVRMGPSDTSAVQVQIKKGGAYTVVKERGDWLQFKSGGWVMAKYVKKV